MACCYIAASMIAFILRSADALDIGLDIQYNDEVTHSYGGEYSDEDVEVNKKPGKEAPTTPLLLVTISGMTCGACVGTVEQAVREVDGVDDVQVSLALQEARVFLRSVKTDDIQSKIVSAIETAGYGAVHAGCDAPPPAIRLAMLQHTDELATLRATLTGLGQYGAAVFALGTGTRLSGWTTSYLLVELLRSLVLLGLTIAAVWTHARWILESAWKAAKTGRATMHTLITASTLVGLSLGTGQVLFGSTATGTHYDSILGVLLIVSLGRYMDLLSRRKATKSFAGLYTLLEQTSTVELAKMGGDDNKSAKGRKIPAHLVRPGDEIVIHPYRLIPCDSYVVSGTSHTNEAIVTGEARPRPKGVGDRLLAGSKNGPGLLRAAVINNDDGCSFLAQLVSRVEGALATKPAAQKKIDGITQYFVSAVIIVAVVAATVDFYSVSHLGLSPALTVAAEKLMVVLAAACPCALGLAVPCAVMAGIDVAWQNGILMLQGAETMEQAAATTHVVLDKTGTLTRGTPEVTEVDTSNDWKNDTQTLATLICAAEVDAMASHPLASAVFRHMLPLCGEESWRIFRSGAGQTSDTKTVPGRGVQCQVTLKDTTRHVVVGSLAYLQETGVKDLPADVVKKTEENDHGSRVFVGVDGNWAATLSLHDKPKTDALQTLAALRRRGLHVSMLTGDSAGEAARISKALSIPVAGAAATPDKKLQHIRSLQSTDRVVMMVGDGLNDAPALAAADFGVMLAHGTRCLAAGGGVLLLHAHQLGRLVVLRDLSKTTLRCVYANLVWALAYNVVAVSLAVGLGSPLGIKLTPPLAAAMMSFSSLSVTLSGLALRRYLAGQYRQEEK